MGRDCGITLLQGRFALPYPEGVAAAEVLKVETGNHSGSVQEARRKLVRSIIGWCDSWQ